MPSTFREIDIAADGPYVTTATVAQLVNGLSALAAERDVSTVLLHGNDEAFCLGRRDQVRHTDQRQIRADLQPLLDFNDLLQRVPYVVIAAVEGAAHGFGFGVAAGSDITIVAADASLRMDEIRHGIPPLLLASYLPRLTHPKLAFQLLVTGGSLSAATACAAGLVSEVVEPGTALARARELAREITLTDADVVRMLRSHFRNVVASYASEAAADGVDLVSRLLATRRAADAPADEPWG